MTAVTSNLTQLQTTLLSEFRAARRAAQGSNLEYAKSYAACIDAGMDMTGEVSPGMHFRLLALAEGRLADVPADRLMLATDSTIRALTALPMQEQEVLWDSGAEVPRKGIATIVPVDELTATEGRKFVDIRPDGTGRLLSASEQLDRRAPVVQKTRRDKQLPRPYAYPKLYNAISDLAAKKQMGVQAFIIWSLEEATGVKNVKPKRR